MAKVAITGATGFIGGALARALAGRGMEIVALARPNSDRSRLANCNVKWVVGDVTAPDTLRGFFAGADYAIHAAGMLGQAGVPEAAYHRLHEQGTNNVLAEVERTEPRPRVLYVSSPGVLGLIAGAAADESAPPAPSNAYERSKAAAEQIVRVYAAAGLPVVIGRPEFVYGPGDTHVLGLFRAVAQGRFFYIGSRDYTCHPTYVDDAVDGLLRCLEDGQRGEIYHVTGPRAVTFGELAETIAAALDVPQPRWTAPRSLAWLGAAVLEAIGRVTRRTPPLSRSGVAFFSENRRFSWEKARRELGYVPQTDLVEGVARTVAWYRQQGML